MIEDDKIEVFIKNHFPTLEGKREQVILIKADSWDETIELADKTQENISDNYQLYPSWNRDMSISDSLLQMDNLRFKLIINSELKVIFYTHLDSEYSLARKKFKLFYKDEQES